MINIYVLTVCVHEESIKNLAGCFSLRVSPKAAVRKLAKAAVICRLSWAEDIHLKNGSLARLTAGSLSSSLAVGRKPSFIAP